MDRYYIKSGNSKAGPFSQDALQSMAQAKQLQGSDLLSKDGKNWVQAGSISGLFNGADKVAKARVSGAFGVFTLLKFLIPACIFMFSFGFFLGWIKFTPDLKAIALVQETRDKYEAENNALTESIRTRYFLKTDHQKDLAKITDESNETIAKLQIELKKNLDFYNNNVIGFETKLKKAVIEAKDFSGKLAMLEEAILPFKDLVISLPEDPKLLDLLMKLQKTPEGDRSQAVVNCLKVLGESKGDVAQSLKFEYKANQNRFNESIAELIISWSLSIDRLYILSTTHKNTAACQSVMEDIGNGKDPIGKFMLEQLSDANKREGLKNKINASLVAEGVKNKALVALEKSQMNSTMVLELLNSENQGKPKVKPKQSVQGLQDNIQELIKEIALKTRDEDPLRFEMHALQLETLSEMVKGLALMTGDHKEVVNDLKKYKFFIPFGRALESKELRTEFARKTYEKLGVMSSRKPEDLKKHLESIAFNFQIVEISGLLLSK